ncbi:MAG TPA: hypothetical protein VD926_03375, partial [Acidimicrobiales bacterium]|nr:hypothetical protein [Acidimicrobiales bacterium]
LLGAERDAAVRQSTWLDRARYRPQQWSTMAHWKTYGAEEGGRWLGFARVKSLDGVPPDILMVPLTGHTYGHAGVAVRGPDGWLLLAGDAYFYREEMNVEAPRCTPGLRFYQWMMEKDRRERLANQDRLRELKRAHGSEVAIVCSHDVEEFRRQSGRNADLPAPRRQASPAGGDV